MVGLTLTEWAVVYIAIASVFVATFSLLRADSTTEVIIYALAALLWPLWLLFILVAEIWCRWSELEER